MVFQFQLFSKFGRTPKYHDQIFSKSLKSTFKKKVRVSKNGNHKF